jgi:protoporphyrinogen/coproporphyrinogen III oxidase
MIEKSDKKRVAIAGAGLTGLTIAFYLKKAGIDFKIYERSDRPGGVIQTHHENGFTYESGPNTGVLNRLEAVELLEDLKDYCKVEIADNTAKARWIWKNNKWEPLPSGLVKGITTPLFTFPDKLRLLTEPFRKKGENPNETLAELVLRRMGKSFLNYAIDPFILGIYSGDPSRLVTQYAFPKLYQLEQDYGSFIGGAFKKAMEPKSETDKKVTKEIFSVEGGLGNLITALTENIGEENINLNCKDLSFIKKGNKYTVGIDKEEFTHVISATGSYELKNLFPFIEKNHTRTVNKMAYSRVVQVALGFKNWEGIPLRAFGGLVPHIENRRILGVLFISSFLKNKAPQEGALLSVFLGGIRNSGIPDMTDDGIIQIVEEELKEMLKLESFNPDLIKVFRYQHAIPQYGIESEDKLKTIAEIEARFPGLILAGNIRDGIGIADRIKQGKNVALEMIDEIHQK